MTITQAVRASFIAAGLCLYLIQASNMQLNSDSERQYPPLHLFAVEPHDQFGVDDTRQFDIGTISDHNYSDKSLAELSSQSSDGIWLELDNLFDRGSNSGFSQLL
ncbi:hypothetical protein GCM10011369_15150 [Neiella marina]|uniref:Uncharacterized protein n=1 Tax=Neiella marina TaxID=508461 RepID=A0A8J2U4G0_9GAMM|nr:hypothetical protein [Neiella marina]GGA74283.1 hypothetical protein GCM10011369_15150 [Neiella marina]